MQEYLVNLQITTYNLLLPLECMMNNLTGFYNVAFLMQKRECDEHIQEIYWKALWADISYFKPKWQAKKGGDKYKDIQINEQKENVQ